MFGKSLMFVEGFAKKLSVERIAQVLAAAVFVVAVSFAGLVISNDSWVGAEAYADTGSADRFAIAQISDRAYKPAVGVGVTPIKATPEAIAELDAAAEAAAEEATETEEAGGGAQYDVAVSGDTEEDWQSYEGYAYEGEPAPGEMIWVGDDYYIYNPNIGYNGEGYYNANLNGVWHDGASFAFDGRYYDACGLSFTYYSEKVLPGGGLYIPGRHVNDEGYVCDENGYICLAADNFLKGTVISIPFGCGTGVVYDKGSGNGNLDVYTSW